MSVTLCGRKRPGSVEVCPGDILVRRKGPAMSRTLCRVTWPLLLVVLAVTSVWAQPRPTTRDLMPLVTPRVSLSLEQQMHEFLVGQRVGTEEMEKDLSAFKALPPEGQALVVEATKPEFIGRLRQAYPNASSRIWQKVDAAHVSVLAIPSLSALSPSDASMGEAVLAIGRNFKSTSVVHVKGTAVTTLHLSFFGVPCNTLLLFFLPASGLTYGSSYPVQVYNGTLDSNTLNYPVVAPRGYRGKYGWKFANKGGPWIPWAIYRNYFGASAVEYADGTHKPAAQSWYDSRYKKIGDGGNCYGMSLMSLRIKHWNIGGLLFNSWWTTNRLGSVWEYNSNRSNDEVWQSVQEMQGSQLAEPQNTLLFDEIDANNPNARWEEAKGIVALSSPPHGCVMGMVGGGGHATVVYKVGPDEATRKLYHYDNNTPYYTTETGGPDRSVANVNKAANTFSYGGYYKIGIWDLPSLLVAPSLPADALGSGMGAAATSSYLSISRTARITQITDEAGNQFYAGNQENLGANRIPGAVYSEPFMGLGPTPLSYPHTFLFMNSRGKSYTVEFAGGAGTEISFVQKGLVADMLADGASVRFTAAQVNDQRRFRLENPSGANLRSIRLISIVGPAEQRTIDILNLRPGADLPLELGLNAAGNGLQLINRSQQPLQAQVSLRVDRAGLHTPTSLMALNIPGSQTGLLTHQNWQNLQGLNAQFELQSLTGQRLNLMPMRTQ